MSPQCFEINLTAMGVEARIVADLLPDRAVDDLLRLERLWSRFMPESEISYINRHAGRPVVVSEETASALRFALECREWTQGLFDPLLHDAMCALGYDRSFEFVGSNAPARPSAPRTDQAAWVDHAGRVVFVPAECRIDLGGVGKGIAADFVVQRLRERGARRVAVDVGGDMHVVGTPTQPWWIDIEDPYHEDRTVATLCLAEGAVATSSVTRRRWASGGRAVHHLLDPRTGAPAEASALQATVIAPTAAMAEVLAKLALIVDFDSTAAFVDQVGAAALLVEHNGALRGIGDIDAWLAPQTAATIVR